MAQKKTYSASQVAAMTNKSDDKRFEESSDEWNESAKVPPTDGKSRAQRGCKVCRARTQICRDTRYDWAKCPSKPGLSLEGCIKDYNTIPEYWIPEIPIVTSN